MWQQLLEELLKNEPRALARTISFVENEQDGYEQLLESLPFNATSKIIGITGPPGAGKSTITDALIGSFVNEGKKVAVLCIDPSSPFHYGAVLGDRIRMNAWFTHPQVFIRSLATRGSLGGLHPHIIEITELAKAGGFDIIIVETVGVGQSEVEIAGLADTTVVVVVPEGGDEIQTMKAGIMEIADIFVVNKSDRPGADNFVKNLKLMLAPAFHDHQAPVPIIKTTATEKDGIPELVSAIKDDLVKDEVNDKKNWLLAEKAFYMIRQKKMRSISKEKLRDEIKNISDFNLYRFVKDHYLKQS
jgi:LAO/AO transport system kinase